jgi:hypothetical protein
MQDTIKNPFPIGSISTGTHKPEDLIPSYLWTLRELSGTSFQKTLEECIGAGSPIGTFLHYKTLDWVGEEEDLEAYLSDSEAQEDLVTITDALEECAPPYVYFGTLEGDGANFGFWPCLDSIESDRACGELNSGDELPDPDKSVNGYFLQVSDHGNMTLYGLSWTPPNRTSETFWEEVWSCV